MLSSTISSVSTSSITLQQSLAPSTALLRSAGSLPRRPRSHQQIRNYRLSLWSSYLDPTFQKEIRRRYGRVVKHKHIDALNRKLSWDRHFPGNPRHTAFKGFMCSAWRGQDSRPGGRWINVDELKTVDFRQPISETGDKVDHSRPEHPMNNRDILYEFIRARSRMFGHGWSSTNIVSNKSGQDSASSTPSTGFADSSTYGKEGFSRRFHNDTPPEPEYEIDPITNRRIHKASDNSRREKSPASENPIRTFKGYRSQFQNFEPPNSSEKPTAHVSGNRAEDYRQTQRMKPAEKLDPVEEGLKIYDEKVDYKSGRFYSCAGIAVDYSDPVQNGLKDYDNKISDGKACPESDIKMAKNADPIQNGLAEYDAKFAYRSGGTNEMSEEMPGQENAVSQAIREYESRNEQPIFVKKFDTKSHRLDPVEEAIREYESCESYRQTRKDKQAEALLKAIHDYEANYQRFTTKLTDPKPDPEKLNPVLKAIQEYESATSEDEMVSSGIQEPLDPILKAFREYKAATEVGQRESKSQESVPGQTQLNQLLQSIEEHKASILKSGLSGNRSQEKCPVQQGLEAYDAKVDNYRKPSVSERPSVKSVLLSSKPQAGNTFKPATEETTEDLDLLRTSDVRAASGILKSPAKETDSEKSTRRKALENHFDDLHSTQAIPADEAAAAEKVKDSRKLAEELRIEHSELLNHAAHARGRIDAKIAEVEQGWQPEESSQRMTGNFVRDFPEEFKTTWTSTQSENGGLIPSATEGQDVETDPHIAGLAPKGSFSRNPGTPRIETSMDRAAFQKDEGKANVVSDPVLHGEGEMSPSVKFVPNPDSRQKMEEFKARRYDSQAFNMRKQKDRDLVREVRSIYEDAYGTIDSKHRQASETSEPESTSKLSESRSGQLLDPFVNTPEPTLYKILAYDPTMQSVSTAETTSIVPDSSDSLTPADVLLRLSNPSKFFPHFQSLQSQGYEIVAGSGDVLVFRKVRSGAPVLKRDDTPAEAHEKAVKQERKRVTNPIDGMQSTPIAATGDFASPTGFVNYDLPRGSETPFKSNIDVRREEPVFSGRRNWGDDSAGERPKAKGRSKKILVGAAWVAACSYAVGVVSEFFRTGGMDGKGPQGF